MTEHPAHTCPNCGSEAGPYCPSCGQKQGPTRLSVGQWLLQLLDEFAINATVPRTLWLLLTRPGFLASEWRAGRRARYTSPLRLYILASIVFFSVTFFVGLPFGQELHLDLSRIGTELGTSATELRDEAIARRMRGILTLGAALSVPLLALWMRLRRRKSGLLYVDHLVVSLHVHAVLLFLLTPAWIALFFGRAGAIVALLLVLAAAGYWIVTWWRTYRFGRGRLRSLWSLVYSSAGWAIMGLVLLIAQGVVFGTMIDGDDIRTSEFARGAYPRARAAYEADDVRRAKYLAEAAVGAFARVDSASLDDHEPYHIAELYLFADRPDTALERAEALLESDPEDLLLLGLAGVSAAEAGDSAVAREYLGKLLELTEAGAENDEGHASAHSRHLRVARGLFGRETVEDRLGAFHRRYIQAQRWTYDYDDPELGRRWAREGLALFERMDSLPEHAAYHRGELLRIDRRLEEAHSVAQSLLAADSTDVLALGLAGMATRDLGDTVTARRIFTRLLERQAEGAEPVHGHGAEWRRYVEAARALTR